MACQRCPDTGHSDVGYSWLWYSFTILNDPCGQIIQMNNLEVVTLVLVDRKTYQLDDAVGYEYAELARGI